MLLLLLAICIENDGSTSDSSFSETGTLKLDSGMEDVEVFKFFDMLPTIYQAAFYLYACTFLYVNPLQCWWLLTFGDLQFL